MRAAALPAAWLTACDGMATGDKDGVASIFPSFTLTPGGVAAGYLQYAGDMVGSGYKLGALDGNKAAPDFGSGITGTARAAARACIRPRRSFRERSKKR